MDEQLLKKLVKSFAQTTNNADDSLAHCQDSATKDKDTIDKICAYLSEYSFDELYRWLAATAVLPHNQMFELRFEAILTCLISIPENKFINKKLRRGRFCQLLTQIDALVSPYTVFLEDFTPFPQLKKIPLFTPEATFYFFYGSYEQPYLNWKRLMESIYPVLKKTEHPLSQMIEESLNFQTSLLEEIGKKYSSGKIRKNIFVPPEEVLNNLGSRFTATFEIDSIRTVEVGSLDTQDDLLSFAINDGMRTVLLVKNKSTTYFWLPCDHFDGILYAVKELIMINSPIINSINIYSRGQFANKLWGLFKLPAGVENIYSLQGKSLAHNIDEIAMIDEQNIILFKHTSLTLSPNLEHSISEAANILKETIDSILSHDMVLLKFFNNERDWHPKVSYWGVIVFDLLPLEKAKATLPREENLFCYSYSESFRFLEKSPSTMTLFHFLIDDRKQMAQGCITTDAMDRFVIYLQGNGYVKMGIQPDMMVFAPHSGSNAVQEDVFEKYQDNIHEMVYRLLDNEYDYIECHEESYDVYSKTTGAGGKAIKIGSHLLFIRFPWPIIYNEPNKLKKEICSSLLAPLILYFVERLHPHIVEFLARWKNKIPLLLQVDLLAVDDAKSIEVLVPILTRISNQMPVVCESFLTEDELLTGFVFDCDYLQKYLATAIDNMAEKEVFSQLLASWISLFEEKNAIESSAQAHAFLDSLIGVEKKGFSLDIIPIKNPLLEYYPKAYEFSDISIGHMQRQIAEFLVEKHIASGIHQNAEAKSICNEIFSFLWDKLLEGLSLYNSHSLVFIYRQIELLEGMRENLHLSAGLQKRIRTEFDAVSKFKEDYLKIIKSTETAKYIFQVAYSLRTNGKQHITNLNWQELQAIGWWIGEISHISDALHFETADYSLKISDMYDFSISYNGSPFNFEEFQLKHANDTIVDESQKLENRLNPPKEPADESPKQDFPPWFELLDNAFIADFGFPFSSFCIIADALRFADSNGQGDFPLKLFSSETQLIQAVIDVLKGGPEISESVISRCFDLMTTGTINVDEIFLPTKLPEFANRLNISPLLRIEDEIIFGNQMVINSRQLLCNMLSAGGQPFDLSKHPALSSAIKEIHRQRDTELEEDGFQVAIACLGKDLVEKNILNFKRISTRFASRPSCGEIDLLAVNKDIKIIFVIDAKNQKRGRLPAEIQREARYFWGEGGHTEKLQKKEIFVKDNIDDFLRYFKITDSNEWSTKKAFITNVNFISAFKVDNDIDFVLLSELHDYLLTGVLTCGRK